MRGKRLKLTGRRFERLTVIKLSHSNKHKNTCWLCKCDCGNEKIIKGSSLTNERTRSCGCLQKEHLKKRREKAVDKIRLPEGIAARNCVINTYKQGAKRRGLEWNLTNEQIIVLIKEDCHYCGSPPSNILSHPSLNGSYTYTGIDRVDNDIGYFLDNVVSCCDFCNRAKKQMSVEEFQEQIKRIYLNLL